MHQTRDQSDGHTSGGGVLDIAIIGGGPIGLELAVAMRQSGARAAVIEAGAVCAKLTADRLAADG